MSPPYRVLFVDDDQAILDGLHNLLRKQHRVWDMVFVTSGAAALEALRLGPFDVIVSDMRMPGMDGATLLTAVKETHPNIARIILSGQSEREALVKALPLAHQFLSKPCDGAVLRIAIERTCRLQKLLHDETLRKAVGGLDALPSPSQTYRDLIDALSDSDIGLAAVAEIVERDPAMSAKVLQLANSAYFGLPKRVTSISQATMFLGADVIKGLVLTAQVFSTLGAHRPAGVSMDQFQSHSLMTARLAKHLVSDRAVADDAFTAALLHDIGQIAMAVGLREQFTAILRDSRGSRRPLQEVEYEHLGVSHAEVGGYLLGVWGLPFSIVEAVACHHRPGSIDSGDRDVLAAVHLAETVVEEGTAGPGAPAKDGLDHMFLEASGWTDAVPKARAWAVSAHLAADHALSTSAGSRQSHR